MKRFVIGVSAVVIASAVAPAPLAGAATHTVTYAVTTQSGQGEAGKISYSDHAGAPQSVDNQPLPWSVWVTWPYSDIQTEITAIQSTGPVTCVILVDGRVVTTNTGAKTVNCRYKIN